MIYVDSLNDRALELIKLPIFTGLTTNPSIVKKDRPEWGFEKTLIFLENISGKHFIQGSLSNESWIKILEEKIQKKEINPEKFTIKLPWIPESASKYVDKLHSLNLKVCATAVYSLEQCYTAILSSVDFVAVYYDRMKKNSMNPDETIDKMLALIDRQENPTRILAASIKDVETANNLLIAGIHDLTLPLDISEKFLNTYFPMNDCETFENDFRI
jgi:transaldolase